MPRFVTRASLSTLFLAWACSASAQTLEAGSFDSAQAEPLLVGYDAASRGGRVHGVVRDDAGRAVVGASVVAVGGTVIPVASRSDVTGQFVLLLQPGEYVLRANRPGYVSAYREPVRIQSSTQLERNIVLTRSQAAAPPVHDVEGTHAHSDTAWRLRHVTPTALRDIASARIRTIDGGEFRPHPSFVDWMMGESARAAASFFLNTDFSGQVNFMTTSTMGASSSGWLPAELPRGIAYIAVGAPVGSAGDWSVRGALSSSALQSWVVMGEYKARGALSAVDGAHAFRVGVSYSSQPMVAGSEPAIAAMGDRVRSAGGVYGFDRWQVHPSLELDYGVRLDRYDYAADSQFVSPRLGFRVRALPTTYVTMLASQSTSAPGANEFLPPVAGGVWLPPERTFAPLLPGAAFRAERVRDVQLGIEHRFSRAAGAPVVAVQRVRQSTADHVATLYGLDAESDVGHYYVATPGSVTATGWAVRLSGHLAPRVTGSLGYMTTVAEWTADADSAAMAVAAPGLVRPARDRFQDVRGTLHASIPETATRIGVAYRVSGARSADPIPTHALAVGRFDVEVRQGLPLRLLPNGKTELVVLFRNLSRDVDEPGSMYDEMLTVAPPLRIMGGVQVKF
jgi:hypothetical protein